MQLLILFCLQTDLMNHFIFFEFTGVFLFIHIFMATTLQLLKFYFFCLVIPFFVSLAPIIVMVPGDCCFYVYCVNVRYYRKNICQFIRYGCFFVWFNDTSGLFLAAIASFIAIVTFFLAFHLYYKLLEITGGSLH